MQEDQAQAQFGAKAHSSPFDRAVDSSRASRMAALEVARQMRVEAREQMKQARSHRKQAALKNEALEKFVRNCQELGIDMTGIEVPVKKSQTERSSNGDSNEVPARAEATAA